MRKRIVSSLRRQWIGVLALVLITAAIGDAATAGGLITGKHIKNNSVTAKDIKNGTIGNKDVRKNSLTAAKVRSSKTVNTLTFASSSPDASSTRALASSGAQAAADVAGENRVELGYGETFTVLKDPFSFIFTCENEGGNFARAFVRVTSSAPIWNMSANDVGIQTLGPGDDTQLATGGSTNLDRSGIPPTYLSSADFSVNTDDGYILTHDSVTGKPCVFNLPIKG